MKHIYIKFVLLIFFLALSCSLLGQINMPVSGHTNETVTGGENFYDSRGSSNNYRNNEDGTITFNSAVDTRIRITFTDFRLRNNGDFLYIYDGVSTSDPSMGTFNSNGSPGSITSSSNSITFRFSSNSNNNHRGWAANIEVVAIGGGLYCDSYGNTIYDTSITLVDFNTINNATSKLSGYNDYTAQATDVSIGNSYDLSVNVNTDGAYWIYVRVWIDWNQDGDFTDSGEEFDLGRVRNTTNGATNDSPYSITVPAGADIGATRMRVSANYNAYPDECDNDFDGEVEDYTLNVIPGQPNVSLEVGSSSINENGGSTTVTARLDAIHTQEVVITLDVSGAVSASDYTISSLNITIPIGSTSGSVIFSAIDDSVSEADEGAVIDIVNVSNASESGTQQETITIIDDDGPSTDPIEVDDQSPESTYSADELVQNVLVTGCLTATNVNYSGNESLGLGYFNAGTSDFPLSSGVIISTGNVNNSEGPNVGGNASNSIGGVSGDSDVNTLTSNSGPDAQILEFDFVPAGDKLEFRYIFASEEYPEFVGQPYNDVFGFILSGPGITADAGLSGKNIALIPGTSQEVAINSVNSGSNSAYYIEELTGYATIFDGRTTVLTASADVVPCQTYHIRLIITDVWDDKVNSAVFLEAESFKSNEVVIENGIDLNDDVEFMYEGCDDSFIKFLRTEGLESSLTVDLNISGSAENGIDYLYVDQFGSQIGDGKLPTTMTMPIGVAEVIYYYKVLSDGVIEGDEDFRISFLKSCPCSAPDYYEKVINIIDVPEIEASPTSLVSCLGATPVATITVNLKGGLDPADYQYSLNGGVFQDNNVFTLNDPAIGSMHIVTVEDKFKCSSENFDVTIPGVTPIEAHAGPDKTMCEGDTPQLEGSGGIYYEWSCSPVSGLPYLSDVNAPNATIADDIPFGIYTFTLTVKESSSASALCVDTDNMVLTVKENSHFTIASNQAEYCSGETINLSTTIINSQAGDIYSWTPAADVNNPNAANTSAVYTTLALAAKDFSLTVTKSNGCNNTENISGVLIHPEPTVSLNASSNICADVNDGQLDVDASGGTPFGSSPFYTYSWSHNVALTLQSATGLSSGSYIVTVTDSKNCSALKTFEVSQKPRPIGVFHD